MIVFENSIPEYDDEIFLNGISWSLISEISLQPKKPTKDKVIM